MIDAGIVGAATAFYLSRAGAKVTVLDANPPSAGATGASDRAVSVASKRPGVMMPLAQTRITMSSFSSSASALRRCA